MAAFDNIWKNLGYCEQYFSNKIGQRCGGPKTQIKKPKKINKNATMGYPNFRKSKFLQKWTLMKMSWYDDAAKALRCCYNFLLKSVAQQPQLSNFVAGFCIIWKVSE